MILGSIVEGDGEVQAVPTLVRRIVSIIAPGQTAEVLRPYRVSRHKVVKEGELERVVDFVGRRTGAGGGILVLIDADDDCPAELGPSLLVRARARRPDRKVAVVLAKREFEAWFIAAAESLAGSRSLSSPLVAPANPEQIRGAKEWLGSRMGERGYSPSLDQPAFAAAMDIAAARAAPSFDKLFRDISFLFGG